MDKKPDEMELTSFYSKLALKIFQSLAVVRGSKFRASAVVISGVLSVYSYPVSAKEIYLQPTASTRLEYDDNIRLRTERSAGNTSKSAYGAIARFGGRVGVRSERYDIMLNNDFEIKRYDSDYELDSENIYIDLSSNVNVTQRNVFSLNGNYTRDTTLTSELDVTGLVQSNIIREAWSISPEWMYYLSNTQFLRANFTHYDVMYEDSDTAQFFDYTTDSLSLTYIQQWTELLNTYLSVSAMSFEVPELRRETTEYTVNIGAEYQFLPTWSASFSIGRRFTNTEITFSQTIQPFQFLGLDANGNPIFASEDVTVSDDVQGMVFSFELNKQFEAGVASLAYSRSTSAQGNGRQQLVDRFKASVNRKITEKLSISLNGGITSTTTSGSQNFGDDRTYYHISPVLNWRLNRQASLNAGYRYRMQDYENDTDPAVSNAVFINFSYQWDKLRTQRY